MTDDTAQYPARDVVHRIDVCRLRAGAAEWPFALEESDQIEAIWQDARLRNPNYFNGTVYLVDQLSIAGGALDASLLRSDFKSYLHWRQSGFPQTGVRDGFGSALIRAVDGAYLLGRQRPGNVNAGLTYLPGGFIDGRDVAADGEIDIAASIAREMEEETGLMASDVTALPGFLVTETGAHLSLAKTYQSPLDSVALKARIERHLAGDVQSELDSIAVISTLSDLDELPMPDYARVLLTHLLIGMPASA